MTKRPTRAEIPNETMDTPYGRLYRPLAQGWQILVLIAAFAGGPAVGWLVGQVPGDLSENARILLYIPYVVLFFMGYSLWIARLNAIAFEGIGRSLLKTLFLLIIRRRKPESIEEVFPSKEKLLEMAVKAQKAGASFGVVGWPVAAVSGLVALLFDTEMGLMARFTLVAGSCLAWGYALAFLGRRGWLPFMEEG